MDSYVEGQLTEIVLSLLPLPSSFQHRRILTPNSPGHVFLRVEELLSDDSARAILVETISGKQQGRLYFDSEDSVLVEGTKPSSEDDWGDLDGVERLWVSPQIVDEIEEIRERRERDREYTRIAG